jgi:hypothetical protein
VVGSTELAGPEDKLEELKEDATDDDEKEGDNEALDRRSSKSQDCTTSSAAVSSACPLEEPPSLNSQQYTCASGP